MMKYVSVLVVVLMAQSSMAAKIIKDQIYDKAILKICNPAQEGCRNSLVLMDEPYFFVGKTKAIRKQIENAVGTFRFHKMYTSLPFTVTGHFKKVKGIFPNPAAEFTIFEITKIEGLVLPK